MYLFLLSSCGNSELDEPRESRFILHLKLPAAIAGHPARYQHFLERVRFLGITLKDSLENSREFQFPAGSWEKIVLPVTLPSVAETWSVKAEVWDLKQDGYPRSYPMMKGEKKLKVDPGTIPESTLVLGLEISPENF